MLRFPNLLRYGKKPRQRMPARRVASVASKVDPIWPRISEFRPALSALSAHQPGNAHGRKLGGSRRTRCCRRRRSPDYGSPWGADNRFYSRLLLGSEIRPKLEHLNSLEAPIGEEVSVIERLALVPPMSRLVIVDYFPARLGPGQVTAPNGIYRAGVRLLRILESLLHPLARFLPSSQ